MTDACRKIGGCPTGHAVITPGFNLKAKYVIHAVGPVYSAAEAELSEKQLYSCYKETLDLAKENDCHSVGFPLISAGVFGYPKDEAWEVAIRSCNDWLVANEDYPMEVVFAVIDEGILALGEEKLSALG